MLGRFLDLFLGWFFRLFNWGFRQSTTFYTRLVGLALRGAIVVLLVYGGLLVFTWGLWASLPTGYIPNQDQGRFYIAVQLPDAGSLERTQDVVDHITAVLQGVPEPALNELAVLAGKKYHSRETFESDVREALTRAGIQGKKQRRQILKRVLTRSGQPAGHYELTEEVLTVLRPVAAIVHITGIAGQSFTLNANGSNFAQFFVTLADFHQRRHPSLTSTAMTDKIKSLLAEEVPEAQMSLFTPPPVSGLGSASGFKIIVEDRGDLGLVELQKQVERLIAAGNGGHFQLTDRSFAAMRRTGAGDREPIPEPVIARLEALHNRDFLTRDLYRRAVEEVLDQAEVTDKAQKKRILDRLLDPDDVPENRKVVKNLFSIFRANTPQLYIDLNREQCQTHGRQPARRLRYPANLPGLAVRQRLQPLRPDLAGGRPGQRGVPRHDGQGQAAQGSQRPGPDGAAGSSPEHQGDWRTDQHRPLQHVPCRGHPRGYQ